MVGDAIDPGPHDRGCQSGRMSWDAHIRPPTTADRPSWNPGAQTHDVKVRGATNSRSNIPEALWGPGAPRVMRRSWARSWALQRLDWAGTGIGQQHG